MKHKEDMSADFLLRYITWPTREKGDPFVMRKKEIPKIISENTRARAVPWSHPLLSHVCLSAGYTNTDNKYIMQLLSFLVGDTKYFLRT